MEQKIDYAANLAFHLLEKAGSIFATTSEKMTAAEQRALFGRYIGKGRIVINGSEETICNRVKVCFGLDWDDRNVLKFSQLGQA